MTVCKVKYIDVSIKKLIKSFKFANGCLQVCKFAKVIYKITFAKFFAKLLLFY